MSEELARIPETDGQSASGEIARRPSLPLRKYQDARVTIHYNSGQGYRDTGTVTYIDGQWIELMKDNSELILIPVLAIRLVVLLEAGKTGGDGDILLRPADSRSLEKIESDTP